MDPILNTSFTGIDKDVFNKCLSVYREFTSLLSDNGRMFDHTEDSVRNFNFSKNTNGYCSEILNIEFNDLINKIKQKYSIGNNSKNECNSCLTIEDNIKIKDNFIIPSKKIRNFDNYIKKKFVFWVVSNIESDNNT
ncbi:hypothetical protein FG386_000559 [Cryptosporidium ryanae]|uniref:uncharacterized protein n=1 Tax=Cryptosporidium ryanae TaxID=515981 RepID=UPI003519E66C|nr:hypothetical protein FG386_000559 [Cryptosporidium ryanae]